MNCGVYDFVFGDKEKNKNGEGICECYSCKATTMIVCRCVIDLHALHHYVLQRNVQSELLII